MNARVFFTLQEQLFCETKLELNFIHTPIKSIKTCDEQCEFRYRERNGDLRSGKGCTCVHGLSVKGKSRDSKEGDTVTDIQQSNRCFIGK